MADDDKKTEAPVSGSTSGGDGERNDNQARELDREQQRPSASADPDLLAAGRENGIVGFMTAARDKLREVGENEKADAIDKVLSNDRFQAVAERLDTQREQAAPVGDLSNDPNKGEMEFDSASAEVEVEKALQAAAEAGVPSDQISAAKLAISAYQSRKSEVTKGAAEAAVANAKPQMQVANDEAARKFQHDMTNAFAGLAGLASIGALFQGACDEAKEKNPKDCAGLGAVVALAENVPHRLPQANTGIPASGAGMRGKGDGFTMPA